MLYVLRRGEATEVSAKHRIVGVDFDLNLDFCSC